MSSENLVKSRRYKLNERVRHSNYKQGWEILNKYSKYIHDHVTLCETCISLEKVNMYNKQFLGELKSNNIKFNNIKYYKVWVDMYNTLKNYDSSSKHDASSIMNHSVINLLYISNKELSKF